MVIEVMTFNLAEGVSEAEFREADRRVQVEFAYRQPGMVRRTTARAEGGRWVVVDFWSSAADADACLAGWRTEEAPVAFTTLITDVAVERFETLD